MGIAHMYRIWSHFVHGWLGYDLGEILPQLMFP